MMLGQPWQRAYNAQVDWSDDVLHFQSFMGKHTIAFVDQPNPKKKVQPMEKVVAPMPAKEKNAINEDATKVENTASTKGQPLKVAPRRLTMHGNTVRFGYPRVSLVKNKSGSRKMKLHMKKLWLQHPHINRRNPNCGRRNRNLSSKSDLTNRYRCQRKSFKSKRVKNTNGSQSAQPHQTSKTNLL